MNFMFEWQKQHLTSKHSEQVRYCSCHLNIKFISSSLRVMFFLLYGFTYDGVFDDFPNISGHFPKIFQICSEGQTKFSKIAEDCRRFSRKTRRYFDHTSTNLSTILTNLMSVKSLISSLVRIRKIRHSSSGCRSV